MPISVEEFVKQITEFGLVRAEELSALSDSLPPDERPKDAEQWAKHLVQTGKLTRYQASNAFRGKAKGLVFGEYVVLDKLGAGGMGQVFKAEHRRMKRRVALKALPPTAMQGDGIKRFYQEVQTAALLTHPNIVTAYDAGEAHGLHFLIMEFVEGQDLASVVKQRGPLPVEQATDCILQAARGLEYAHKQNVIHRDIKPANLLLDKQGQVKILDMGLARVTNTVAGIDAAANEGLTQSGQVMGTVDYMAPEQAQDTRTADARADIYSLGCTFYRLLSGDVPYKADTLIKKILAHREQPIPSLSKARPEVPAKIDAICMKMLAKRPENRYQTMSELIADLEKCDRDVADPAAGLVTDDEPVHGSGIGSSLSDLGSPGSMVRKRGVDNDLGLDASQSHGSSRRVRAKAAAKQPPPKWLLIGGGAGAGLLVVIGALVFFLSGGKKTEPPPAAKPAVEQIAKAATSKSTDPEKPSAQPAKPETKPDAAASTKSSVPTAPAAMTVGQPIDLLQGLQASDRVDGDWTLRDNRLSTLGGRLQLPGIPPADYTLTAVVRRIGGKDAFVLGLVMGDSQVALVIDGFGGKTSVLKLIDGKNHPNETSRSVDVFGDNQPHAISCEVHPDWVKATASGKTILDWHRTGQKLSVDKIWEVPDRKRLFIGVRESAYEITRLELTPLPPMKPAAPVVASAPAATSPSTKTPPATSAPLSAVGPSVSLLEKIDVKRDSVAGEWQIRDGRLISPVEQYARIMIPFQLPTLYRLVVTARRVKGSNSLGLGIKVGGRQALLQIDNWQHGDITAFQRADNKVGNLSMSRRQQVIFGDGQEHTISCTVQPNHVLADSDGKALFEWSGNETEIGTGKEYVVPNKTCLFLSAYSSQYEISKVELVPLAPATDGAPNASVVSSPAAGPAVDLLTKVDPQNDGVSQGWTIQNGKAVSTSEKGNNTLQVSFEPPPDYLLTAVVRRLKGTDSFDIGLPIGSSRVAARFDAWHSTISGLASIDGKNANVNETKHEVSIFSDGQPHAIVCTVHPDSVKAVVSGKTIIDWSGDATRLTSNAPIPNKRLLCLASVSNSSYEVTKLELVPLAPSTKPAGTTPTVGTPQELTGPVDLLKQIQLPRDARGPATWKLQDGALEVSGMSDPWVQTSFVPPESYDLAVTSEGPLNNIRTIVGLIVQGHPAALTWSPIPPKGEIYLRSTDPTGLASRVVPVNSPSVSKAELVVAVRGNRIYATVDGVPCLDWSGDPAPLTAYHNVGISAGSRIFLGCSPGISSGTLRFTKFEVSPPTMRVPTYSRTDLLASLDADRMIVDGKSRLDHGDLWLEPSEGTAGARVRFDVARPSEYVLTALVERTTGYNDLSIGLPTGNRRGSVRIDNNGDAKLGNQTRPTGWLLTPWRLHTVEISLSYKSCRLSIDGREIASFTPDPYVLTFLTDLEIPDLSPLLLRSHATSGFHVTSLELTPLGWQAPPAPSTGDVTKATAELDTILAPARVKNATPQQKLQVAESLWRLAAGTGGDPAKRYAALQNAASFAAQAGDLALMSRSATELGRTFESAPTGWCNGLVSDLFKTARTAAAKQKLAEATLPQIDRAAALEDFDLAMALQAAALTAAKPPTSDLAKELKARGGELRLAQAEHEAYQAAKPKLDGQPDDAAREAAARYSGLVKNDWATAAELLKDVPESLVLPIARGELNTIKDQAKSADHADQLAEQGDHWWALYEKSDAPLKWLAMERAGGWYHLAAIQAAGKTKVRLEQRRTALTQQRKQSGMAFAPRHPYDAMKIGDHWYKFYASAVPWNTAVDVCQSVGGHLLRIDNPAENQAIGQFLSEFSHGDRAYVWLACSDTVKEGDWRWTDGTPVASTYSEWQSGQPDNGGGDADFGRLEVYISNGQLQAKWDDTSAAPLPFLCEWDY